MVLETDSLSSQVFAGGCEGIFLDKMSHRNLETKTNCRRREIDTMYNVDVDGNTHRE
jgi:hypothetical protein